MGRGRVVLVLYRVNNKSVPTLVNIVSGQVSSN